MSQFGKTCARCQQVLMMGLGKAPPPSVRPKVKLSPVPSPKCIYLRAELFPLKTLLAG